MTPSNSTPTYTNLSPQKWGQLPHPPLLIDVRSGAEYAMFHAPHAVNFSLHRLLLGKIPGLRRWAWPAWFRDLTHDQPIALICLTAHRSPIAASQLSKAGFTQIFNITGGMMQWRQLGLETVSGSQPIPDTPAQGCVEEGSKA
ncbi:rhodanese-like domain-containing protein [Acaryochloris sp. CCMEE 5410]|uniref:rhodanese-like domain-containing protein n=1 Tax=Acaryochloris sp. CCMEE 5410 TaxID=310037 RepID=UPI00024850B7|nr:rhodanese-like domain-containing protein [Acaryochloris sp. CCMEE 5410]KAI9129324.1 rhodanese-like domain-containing protein [Acaryochloris sp. CCMEE 5410]